MKNKILRSMCALLLLLLAAMYAIFCVVMYRQNVTTAREQLRGEAVYLKEVLDEVGGSDTELLNHLAEAGTRVTLVDADGDVVFDSDGVAAQMENHAERPEIESAMENGWGEAERYSDTFQEQNFYYAVSLDDGQVLRLAVSTDSVYGTLSGQFFLAAILACVVFLISVPAADRLARRIVEPINQLDLRSPLQNVAYDELSPLLTRLEKQNRQIDEQIECLKARHAEFTAITENMQEGLVILNGHLQVLSINESARKILGVDRHGYEGGTEGKMGEKDRPLEREGVPLHILNLNRSQELLQAVREAQAGRPGRCRIEEGGRKYSLLASPVAGEEGKGGVVIFLLDVTDQMEAEQMRREFSANVSHELKTPLTSISGYAEIMENGLVKAEDVSRFAGRIHKEALRLIQLVEDIIQLSRLDENSTADWQQEPVELLGLCNEVAGRLASQAGKRGITIEVSGEKETVTGVRRLLDEMITNLCDNAVKYNKDGGSVKIAVGENKDEIWVSVADSGIGIAPEHHGRIFERFYRVDKSHSRETGGTGLGLSIVKHAAVIHNARIDLESEENKGTKITVFFPAAVR